MNIATRSTAQAGQLAAGHALHHDDTPVAALLAQVATVADADQLHPILERRVAAAEAAVADHGPADPLWEDAEHAAHAEVHAALVREVTRCQTALDRLAARRAELVVAEAQAAAREAIKAAEADDREAERLAGKVYVELAARLGDVLGQLDQHQRRVVAARQQAEEAGIGDEAAHLVTPSERRFRPAQFEWADEVVDRGGAPRVTDGQGRLLNGRGGRDLTAEPQPVREVRRVERMTSPPMRAPDLARVRIVLPSPEPGEPPLVDRRGDA